MDAVPSQELIDSVKGWLFSISAVALCGYPAIVLVWTMVEGSNAEHKGKARLTNPAKDQGKKPKTRRSSTSWWGKRSKPTPLTKRVRGFQLKAEEQVGTTGNVGLIGMILMTIGFATFLLSRSTFGFVIGKASGHSSCGKQAAVSVPLQAQLQGCTEEVAEVEVASSTPWSTVIGVMGCAGLIGMTAAFRSSTWGRASAMVNEKPRRGNVNKLRRAASGGMLRRCSSSSEVLYTRCDQSGSDAQGVPVYKPPPDTGVSMWHHVDLHVKTWLDEETGLFRYVNEIPMGSLQKFELQTRLVDNVIREDAKGSRKLKSFGVPVPFNYGCFPQTFRDPDEVDEIFSAPGDDDPLDILDLSMEVAGVGQVVSCRPLGAVCLIDEGQADWKIIAVNTECKGPLAEARSIEDAERIAPGRIEEALRWMDDFKQHSGKNDTTLHYEIHDAKRAIGIIEKDHAAWRRLVDEATSSGTSRGHWIKATKLMEPKPQVMKFGWPSQAHMPAPLAGSSIPVTTLPRYETGRVLTMRRQTSVSSDGCDSTSDVTSASPPSSDAEIGK
mmetsp:Transcript_31006/g.67748  ORF Transcript_31006/g.67748 Transcript_31006/m.67748 type:complete len:553 (-) Transcript_31006:214-1872(-)